MHNIAINNAKNSRGYAHFIDKIICSWTEEAGFACKPQLCISRESSGVGPSIMGEKPETVQGGLNFENLINARRGRRTFL